MMMRTSAVSANETSAMSAVFAHSDSRRDLDFCVTIVGSVEYAIGLAENVICSGDLDGENVLALRSSVRETMPCEKLDTFIFNLTSLKSCSKFTQKVVRVKFTRAKFVQKTKNSLLRNVQILFQRIENLINLVLIRECNSVRLNLRHNLRQVFFCIKCCTNCFLLVLQHCECTSSLNV